MSRFENTIPPPLLWVAASLLTFVVDRLDLDGSPLESVAADWIAIVVGLTGVAIAVAGLARFAALRTTVNPHQIEAASALATDGIYRFTRNPMYVGMVLLCVGWALRLGTVVGMVVGTGFLVAVLTVLQIKPEERALTATFGQEYERYQANVRRWI